MVKFFVLLLRVCAILPGKAVPEMTCIVSGGTLNPTHSLTHSLTFVVMWKFVSYSSDVTYGGAMCVLFLFILHAGKMCIVVI